ncbi:MAG: hypothetical protein ACT4OG_07470 [Alphaproteobacteria bacterium]
MPVTAAAMIAAIALLLSGCVAITVVDTAASVTGTVISTTADVAGSVVSGAASAIGGGEDDKDKKKDEGSEKEQPEDQ